MNLVSTVSITVGHPKILLGVSSVGRTTAFEAVCQWFEPTTPCQNCSAPNHQQIIMSNTFFISDLHLGHMNILCFTKPDGSILRAHPSGGGFISIEEHDQFVIANINAVVRPRDRLIIVGDCVMNKKFLPKLTHINGLKTLVMGNHDPVDINLYAGLFEKIAGALVISDFIVTHIPVHPNQLEHRFKTNIHGHLHGHPVLDDIGNEDHRYVNVSVESLQYRPISLEDIKKSTLLPSLPKRDYA